MKVNGKLKWPSNGLLWLALMTVVMGMNLFGHIAESYDSQWGYDPGSILTYPPTINHNSSPDKIQAWIYWWTRDRQVLHLLISQLLPAVHAQLPGAGSPHPQWCTACSVYQEIIQLFGGTDFDSAAVICDELVILLCAPTLIHDYVLKWRSGINCLSSTGHPFDHADALRHFVKHFPFGSTFNIIQESILFSLSTRLQISYHHSSPLLKESWMLNLINYISTFMLTSPSFWYAFFFHSSFKGYYYHYSCLYIQLYIQLYLPTLSPLIS